MDNLFGELRLGHLRLPARGPRRRTRSGALQAAAEYAGRWGWSVTAGAAGPAPAGAYPHCACAAVHCAAPGLHGEVGPQAPPGAAVHELRALWGEDPALLLAAGQGFDVLDVPGQPGLQALVRLERMGTQVGPVLSAPTGRLLFFVAAGTSRQLPELLYRMGWDDASLDLSCHGEGDYVAAPPTVLGNLGAVRWLRRPSRENATRPPEARLLLGTLAYACHRNRERRGEPAWLAS